MAEHLLNNCPECGKPGLVVRRYSIRRDGQLAGEGVERRCNNDHAWYEPLPVAPTPCPNCATLRETLDEWQRAANNAAEERNAIEEDRALWRRKALNLEAERDALREQVERCKKALRSLAYSDGHFKGACSSERCHPKCVAARAALSTPTPPTDAARPDDLRAMGYMVAVHNDYRLNGEQYTFWLLTHPNGHWIKGESRTDAEALNQIRAQVPPTTPPACPECGGSRKVLERTSGHWDAGEVEAPCPNPIHQRKEGERCE